MDPWWVGLTVARELLAGVRQRWAGRKRAPVLLEPYVVASHLHRLSDPERRLYVFDVRVANRAETSNTIMNVGLTIAYERKVGLPASNVSFPHRASLVSYLGKNVPSPLALPVDLPARSVRSGLVLFEVPWALIGGGRVVGHTLSLVDTDGTERDQEIVLLQEEPL